MEVGVQRYQEDPTRVEDQPYSRVEAAVHKDLELRTPSYQLGYPHILAHLLGLKVVHMELIVVGNHPGYWVAQAKAHETSQKNPACQVLASRAQWAWRDREA